MNKKLFEKWIEEVRGFGVKPGLSRVKELLRRMDNPQDQLKIIHITGTNGKGTTATLLREILTQAGYLVGQFSTPSLIGFHHMFYVDGPISETYLYSIGEKIKIICDDMISEGLEYPTEYEIISAIMYQYFYERQVDFAVVEVAMGGENDCTNVMNHSILSIITTISLDHTDFLGETLLDIAKEKSGVIKRNSTVIVHPQDDDVMMFLKENAVQKNSILKTFDSKVTCTFNHKMFFEYREISIETFLMGQHQATNIIGVLEAVQCLIDKKYAVVSNEILENAISCVVFEGRFEQFQSWILDGAHNHASLLALKHVLEVLDLYNLIGVFGALKDKDINEALQALRPHFETMIVTEPNSIRKCSAFEMERRLKKLGYDQLVVEPDIGKAYLKANERSGIKLGFGSFYMLSELRPFIK